MRKLDPNIPLRPRTNSEDIDRWNPATFGLQAHRLGLAHMVGHGHMIVTRYGWLRCVTQTHHAQRAEFWWFLPSLCMYGV